MHRISRIALAGIIGIAAFLPQASAQTTLIYDVTVSKFHPFFRDVQKPLKASIEKATQGRVKIKFPAAALAKQRQQWGAVSSGVSDMGIISTGHYRNRLLLPGIAQLPFNTPNGQSASVALWRTSLVSG